MKSDIYTSRGAVETVKLSGDRCANSLYSGIAKGNLYTKNESAFPFCIKFAFAVQKLLFTLAKGVLLATNLNILLQREKMN
jgi:hypothetical protein